MVKKQLSARISKQTKQLLERYAETHGLKRSHLIEVALLHHLQAPRALPADIVIPSHFAATSDSSE